LNKEYLSGKIEEFTPTKLHISLLCKEKLPAIASALRTSGIEGAVSIKERGTR
jgi:hypothetical protein